MIRRIFTMFILLACFMIAACNKNGAGKHEPAPKASEKDPFRNSMVASQYFTVKPNSNEVLEAKKGMRIVTQPACFVNKDGKITEGEVELELAEGFQLEDMVLSNLTTTADGKLLQSGGMFYINATSGGEQVFINPEKPLYVEMPTADKIPGMQLYHGERDEQGNMNWVDPEPIQSYLIPVDLAALDFLPEGFEAAVNGGMPFRTYREASRELADSLYYSLSVWQEAQPAAAQQSSRIEDKLESLKYESSHRTEETADSIVSTIKYGELDCGIDPASVKVLKDPKYQGTYISTREFETRLQSIFRSCNRELIPIYVKYLDRNLWEADSAAAAFLGKDGKEYETFRKYAGERLGNVKDVPAYVKKLGELYEFRLKQVKKGLMSALREARKEEARRDRKIEEVMASYSKLLDKREKYRMEVYGFTLTETGWKNIDTGTGEKPWSERPLDVVIKNTQTFDQVYTYVYYESIRSLYRLNSQDKIHFFVGSAGEQEMPVMKNDPLTFISVAYSGSEIYYAVNRFALPPDSDVSMELQKGNKEGFKALMKQYDKNGKANSIAVDLTYMQQFAMEKERQKTLERERQFMGKLHMIATSCCSEMDGEKLFMANCRSCHAVNEQVVGPALAGVTRRHSIEWLIDFTHNSEAMVRAGDPEAVALFKKYNSVMTPFENLNDEQIISIYHYIESEADAPAQ